MQLSNFDNKVRIGNDYPIVADVRKMGNHCAYGLITDFSNYNFDDNEYYMQVRKHNKQKCIFVAQFSWEGQELPEFWADSEVIYDSREEKSCLD